MGAKKAQHSCMFLLDLSERQRNTMLKHPMAYMHLLSSLSSAWNVTALWDRQEIDQQT
jgi:hypothetical protein